MDIRSLVCCIKGSHWKEKGTNEATWRKFSLKELHAATNNFNYDNKLGEGGFGSCYWGQLWDRSQIAVKRLKVWRNKAEMEFAVEVEILARVRHKENLLSLRGYCAEGQERLIVYDYMANLSLLSHLRGQHESLLDWSRRMTIAIGSAEGIAYLHHHVTPHIIHGDIKASNILLDSDFKAQVADFGFAKLIPEGATHATTQGKGTLGYLAPEYSVLSKASESCDVYSFGILLLELVSGKRPVEKINATTKRPITEWALPLVCERKFSEIADPKMNGKYVEQELKRVVFIGLICAHNQPEKRPTMLEVVELLKGGLIEKITDIENDEMFRKSLSVLDDLSYLMRAWCVDVAEWCDTVIRFVRHVTINYRPAKQQIKDQNDELRRRSVSSAHEDGEFVDAGNCDSVKDQQSNIFHCKCEEKDSVFIYGSKLTSFLRARGASMVFNSSTVLNACPTDDSEVTFMVAVSNIKAFIFKDFYVMVVFWWPLPLPLPTQFGDEELERYLFLLI
ncbi:PTI1-like tyrosine-protein kinase [Tanacetum coccineum]